MEDNFNQNDFEEFLKEQIRNHRMYPNDAVWRDINTKLHGDKKWPALTIAAFALLSATIMICVHFTPKPDIFAVNSSNHELNNSTFLNNLPSSVALSKEKSSLSEINKNKPTVAAAYPAVSNGNSAKVNNGNKSVNDAEKYDKKVIISESNKSMVDNKTGQKLSEVSLDPSEEKEVQEDNKTLNSTIGPENAISSDIIKPSAKIKKIARDYSDKNMVDNFLKDHKEDVSLHTAAKVKSVKNKFGFQIYIAPSISYRKLLEDKFILKEGSNSGPVGLNYVADVNKVVRHKPGNGLEAGLSIMYNLSNNFKIKSGLQFNVRQYSIEAYRSSTEVASIALVENNRIDTVTALAIYRNSNGYYPAELINRYYQIAVPLGVEWEIMGNKGIQLNVAGTIQPTYLINRNAYLLSTNFKNYSEKPDLVRAFNINSNIETFISFKVGDFKWQIGPQLRYQPYSTFKPQYPIKEHLLDYGIKLGLSKTF